MFYSSRLLILGENYILTTPHKWSEFVDPLYWLKKLQDNNPVPYTSPPGWRLQNCSESDVNQYIDFCMRRLNYTGYDYLAMALGIMSGGGFLGFLVWVYCNYRMGEAAIINLHLNEFIEKYASQNKAGYLALDNHFSESFIEKRVALYRREIVSLIERLDREEKAHVKKNKEIQIEVVSDAESKPEPEFKSEEAKPEAKPEPEFMLTKTHAAFFASVKEESVCQEPVRFRKAVYCNIL